VGTGGGISLAAEITDGRGLAQLTPGGGGADARAPTLTWQVESRDGLTIVTVTGTVDTESAPDLYRTLRNA
ncbi:hypothetical protein, partial [Micromonospora sp. RP3T]|uniref:hypothetical protein n=1 Tax=Micromonospora sp. RP3T TaxID=2135446 RepID=UPI003D729436